MRSLTGRVIAVWMTGLMVIAPVAAADKLRIGTEGAYPPFNWVTADGELAGFDIDIARALCERMRRQCVFVTREWSGIIDGLRANDYDAIVASMSVTGHRDRLVDFTRRYYSNKLYLIAPESSRIEGDAAALAGKSISVQRDTISEQWLQHNLGDAVNMESHDTQEEAFIALAAGHVDAALADMLVGYQWLQSDAGSRFEFKGDALYIGDHIAIAVREGDDALRTDFNEAIKAIRGDGTYQRINRKYFPFDIY